MIYKASNGKVLIWVTRSKLPIWQPVSHTDRVVEVQTRHQKLPSHCIEAVVVGLDQLPDEGI